MKKPFTVILSNMEVWNSQFYSFVHMVSINKSGSPALFAKTVWCNMVKTGMIHSLLKWMGGRSMRLLSTASRRWAAAYSGRALQVCSHTRIPMVSCIRMPHDLGQLWHWKVSQSAILNWQPNLVCRLQWWILQFIIISHTLCMDDCGIHNLQCHQ